MSVADDQLTTSDWDTLFTKDPTRFMEALLINILYDDTGRREEVIARQCRVFEKWLSLYSASFRETIAKSVEAHYQHRLDEIIAEAEKRGKIQALANLPIKNSLLNKRVDLEGVVTMLRELKGNPVPAKPKYPGFPMPPKEGETVKA